MGNWRINVKAGLLKAKVAQALQLTTESLTLHLLFLSHHPHPPFPRPLPQPGLDLLLPVKSAICSDRARAHLSVRKEATLIVPQWT